MTGKDLVSQLNRLKYNVLLKGLQAMGLNLYGAMQIKVGVN